MSVKSEDVRVPVGKNTERLLARNCLLKDHRIMIAKLELTAIAGILSDASRVAMIKALLDGRSLTARELSHGAGITPQTASFHLAKLAGAGLVEVIPQGRHKYFRMASDEVTSTLKSMMGLTASGSAKPAAKKQNDVCFARTCYGHLAGRLGVAIAEAMERKDLIKRDGDDEFEITEMGKNFLADLGIDWTSLRKSRRRLASQCLDWSERHPHIGGALGFEMTGVFKHRKWIKPKPGERDITVTAAGRKGLKVLLDIDVERLEKIFFSERQ